MSIPSAIFDEIDSLQAQITAASPLDAAPRANVQAIKLNAAQLVADVQSALVAPGNVLDTWSAPIDPADITYGVLNLVQAGNDQANLALMRGLVGRVASNVNQVPS